MERKMGELEERGSCISSDFFFAFVPIVHVAVAINHTSTFTALHPYFASYLM